MTTRARIALYIDGAMAAIASSVALYHNATGFLAACTVVLFLEVCGRLA